jgi:hypothetical protein
MSYYLELQFCPEYKQLLKPNPDIYKTRIQANINSCKILCSLIATQDKTTLEQANLWYFEYLVNSWAEVNDRKSFVDESFSNHMKRDVIAPKISFGTYTMELFERESEDDEDDPYLELFSYYYQNGRKGKSVLPMLMVRNPYVIERETGFKLPISQQAIVRVGLDFADEYGFRYFNCTNFETLTETK